VSPARAKGSVMAQRPPEGAGPQIDLAAAGAGVGEVTVLVDRAAERIAALLNDEEQGATDD